jgi:hypothetical protein
MGDESRKPWENVFRENRQYNDEQLHFCHIPSCYSCTGYGPLRSSLVNFPIVQTIRRHHGSRLKEHEHELAKLEDLPAFHDKLVESRPLLNYGVYLAIDAISCSSTYLNTYEIKNSDDSYLFLVNLQPLHPDTKSQPLFRISSEAGNGSDVQELFD